MCVLTISLAYLIILLFNNLTSSNSINFNLIENGLDDYLNYGIIIDAGSTGSRLFLYEWTSRSDNEIITIHPVKDENGNPIVKKVSPGLSSFADRPEAAPEYIMPLLSYASNYLPNDKHKETPVSIFATAGMRLLSIEKQDNIMNALREKLPMLTELQILAHNIKVITGKWEGIYSWIAVNYMLGHFNNSNSEINLQSELVTTTTEQVPRSKTAGMVDMGGASAQIAFELPLDRMTIEERQQNGNENMELINLGCRDDDKRFLYRIFVTTFLGFGVNEGAKKYENFLWKQLNNRNQNATNNYTSNSTTPIVPIISDGCLPVNFLKLSNIEEQDEKQFVRKGNGDWDKCVHDIANLIFDDYPNCPITKSCFFAGVKAPPSISLSQLELYGFSEYWFSVDDVLSLGGIYDHDKFEAKAKEFCKQTWKSIKKKSRAKLYPKADSERLQTQCFKSAWIHAILHNGFYVDESKNHFQSAFKINGQEVQWALGAMIYQMRYFPLLKANHRHNEQLKRLKEHLNSNDKYWWSAFYIVGIAVMLFLIWRIWQNKRTYGAQVNGGRSFRYKRLERQSSDFV